VLSPFSLSLHGLAILVLVAHELRRRNIRRVLAGSPKSCPGGGEASAKRTRPSAVDDPPDNSEPSRP
jgi:hypothetical protein